MAIIKSAAVGNATGSLGNITYQTVKSRTIGKQKVNRGKAARYNATDTQYMQRARMAVVGHFAKLVQIDIRQNFRDTLTGWAQNGFMRTNFIVLSVAFEEAIQAVYNREMSARNMSFDYLNEMIKTYVSANPDSIVYSDNASTIVFVNASGWPTPPTPLVIDSASYVLPPMGDPVDISILPVAVDTAGVYTFNGAGLSRARLRLTISGNAYMGTQFQSVTDTQALMVLGGRSSTPGTSLTKVEYLDESGAWQVWSSTSAVSRYRRQMRNLKPRPKEEAPEEPQE